MVFGVAQLYFSSNHKTGGSLYGKANTYIQKMFKKKSNFQNFKLVVLPVAVQNEMTLLTPL